MAKRKTRKKRPALGFLERTERAWKNYEKGKFISRERGEFLKVLEKW